MRKLFVSIGCLVACSGTANVYIPPDEAGSCGYDASFNFPDGVSLADGSDDVSSPESGVDASADVVEEEASACGWVCNQFGYMNTCNSQLADCQTAVNNCSPIMGPCAMVSVCAVVVNGGPLVKMVCQANDVWTWTDPTMLVQPCTSTPVCPPGMPCMVQIPGGPMLSGVCQ